MEVIESRPIVTAVQLGEAEPGWVVDGERWESDPLYDGNPTPPRCYRVLNPVSRDTYHLLASGEYELVE